MRARQSGLVAIAADDTEVIKNVVSNLVLNQSRHLSVLLIAQSDVACMGFRSWASRKFKGDYVSRVLTVQARLDNESQCVNLRREMGAWEQPGDFVRFVFDPMAVPGDRKIALSNVHNISRRIFPVPVGPNRLARLVVASIVRSCTDLSDVVAQMQKEGSRFSFGISTVDVTRHPHTGRAAESVVATVTSGLP